MTPTVTPTIAAVGPDTLDEFKKLVTLELIDADQSGKVGTSFSSFLANVGQARLRLVPGSHFAYELTRSAHIQIFLRAIITTPAKETPSTRTMLIVITPACRIPLRVVWRYEPSRLSNPYDTYAPH